MKVVERFLLYIDILGFSEMTSREPRKVARTYAILDSLNVHRHDSFKTIVFSDTVLVYNTAPAESDEDRNYYVWYLTEFAEDLHHRLTGQDIYFRAVLTVGDFAHYDLDNVECFYGQALIWAYKKEKDLPAIGLFMDRRCHSFNRYFRTADFDEDCSFVYLNRAFEHLTSYTNDTYPFTEPGIQDSAPHLPWQVRFLKDVHQSMRSHGVPAVRGKFLATWDYYQRRYPGLTKALVESDFELSALAGPHAWIEESRDMEKSIRYFKRIGSGTQMSLGITKGRKARSHRQRS